MSSAERPHVTVILTAYDLDRLEDIEEGVESILAGTYEERDVVIVVDGTAPLYRRLEDRWDRDEVTVLLNDENVGAARSRNLAVERARGTIVAFFDDDAVADERWLAELVRCYTEFDAVAAGGKMVPIWLAGEPTFLPEEFFWLIGVTYEGHPEEMTEVRNTFASNLSMRKSVFEELGGFNADIGPKGGSLLQSAETDLCTRLESEVRSKVLYNPDAVVGHKIYEYRTDPVFLLRRAFWQGVSKRGMRVYTESSLDSEVDFLEVLLVRGVPRRVAMAAKGRPVVAAQQLLFLVLATASVGFGYLWGGIKFSSRR